MYSVGLNANHTPSSKVGIIILLLFVETSRVKGSVCAFSPATLPVILGSAGYRGLHGHIQGNAFSAEGHRVGVVLLNT